MGVSGAGKSTVGQALAARLGWAFRDGDSFHTAASVARMASGHPLTDADRWPWLDTITAWMRGRWAESERVVVPCSALRRAYRDRLRRAGEGLLFVHLDAPAGLVAARMAVRPGHFMPPSLLDTQLATLEPPRPDETDALVVPAASGVDAIVGAVLARLA
ncbi:MAG: gluconokinase [Myxococcales bacterium]|nr:MAG: gluconokinase [Myxococcales bacterium]